MALDREHKLNRRLREAPDDVDFETLRGARKTVDRLMGQYSKAVSRYRETVEQAIPAISARGR